MLPQKRTTLLRMALKARVVQRRPRKLGRHRVVVHAVTGRAVHFFFEKRMRERFQRFVPLQLVATGANSCLGRDLCHWIDACMALVTVGARYFVGAMCARVPANTDIAAMTVDARAVLRLD